MLSFNSSRKFQPARIGVMIGFALLLMVAAAMKEPRRSQAASRQPQGLTFEDRVAAQRAIEEVYWRHRLWPKDNPQPKPALEAVMPESAIRAKVEGYLRQSNALAHYWQRPITGEQLQAEMERMARQTKQPEALRELWAALGDDPLLIAECLARPALTERLSREWYTSDERFHGALKQQAGLVLDQLRTGGRPQPTSGKYREVEWRSAESEFARLSPGLEINGVLRLDAAHWQEQARRLTEIFGSAGTTTELPVGRWSSLQEDEKKFYAAVVLEKGAKRLKVANIVWEKAPFDQWWDEAQPGLSLDVQATAFVFRLPQSAAVPEQCEGEAWTATNISGAPATRNGHAAVWTGSEMIVWGGLDGTSFFNSGGRYNPALDTWTPTTTTSAPSERAGPAGIWTGTEMIVWGGNSSNNVTFSTGGRYNPATNSWQPTSSTGAPSSRALGHTAVWTGSEMIIWGGASLSPLTSLTTGGRYNPASNSWIPTTTTNVPGTRIFHTAVWTGVEMIIWGGLTATGGRYDPVSNSWTATSLIDAPVSRFSHSAVWTGNLMIIWGGSPDLNSGGQYNPATNSWTATSATNSPAPRRNHTAVWTGNEMIVWGGEVGTSPNNTPFNSGGRYNPAANTWTATSTTNAPSARYSQIAVWAGNQMIVWGGLAGGAPLTRLNTGGRYILAGALTISPTNQSFPAGGGNGNVSVSASGSCRWTATSNATWITITSGSSGSGNGTVSFSVAANNTTSLRTGTITITGQTFTVTQAAGTACQTVSSVNPTSGLIGSAVTIAGANFTGVTAVKFANNVSAAFTVNSDTQITTTVPSSAVTGPITISKTGCTDVQTASFTVCPMITLTPASLPAGTVGVAYNQTVTASPSGSYTYAVTAGSLPAGLTLNSATGAITGASTTTGSSTFTITATGAANCTGNQAYTINIQSACPTVAGINPTSGLIGSQVTITGANFTDVTAVKFSNNVTASFNVNSATQITATVPAGAVTGPITISKAGCPDVQTGVFTALNPQPELTAISPSSMLAGAQAFTLTLTGRGFIIGSVVRWNGSPRSTTFVGDTQLRAAITADDVAAAGTASVTVFNLTPGGGESSAQSFTIQPNPRIVRIAPAGGAPGSPVNVPIELVSQGDENALSFSLTFDPAVLSAPQAAVGADAAGATLNTNAGQAAQGRFGAILALPTGQRFSAGARRIVNVTFTIANTQATSTNIGFGDQPIQREVSDVNAGRLPANYTPGPVIITSGYEADVAPRPNGDETVTVIDWVQLGRFVAGLDTAANGSEFQRADCAPRDVKGDRRLTASDWTQAGRYAAGIDPVVAAGGPTSPIPPTALAPMIAARAVKPDEPRLLRVGAGDHLFGVTRTVVVELDAQGDENALGFSLRFNPSEWRFVSAEAGRDAREAVIHFNANEAARGRIGLVLALPASGRFSAGARQLVALKFAPVSGAGAKPLAIGFADEPVAREVVSGEAVALPARYEIKSTSPNAGALANVSAASLLAGELAAGQIVAAFGENLATSTQTAASLPLPLELAGVRVLVTDSRGIERWAPLFFVSPAQINYLLPEELVEGVATVKITNAEGVVSLGVIEIAAPAPSLFTANADGQGVAAAVALRIRSDGTQSFEPVTQFDSAQGRFVASPIDLGQEGEVFLLLFGTGLRGRSAKEVTARIGGAKAEVLFAGPQGELAGLDQINIRLPRSLAGRGEVDVVLTVVVKTANTVSISIE